jgi:hypothetical protein
MPANNIHSQVSNTLMQEKHREEGSREGLCFFGLVSKLFSFKSLGKNLSPLNKASLADANSL